VQSVAAEFCVADVKSGSRCEGQGGRCGSNVDVDSYVQMRDIVFNVDVDRYVVCVNVDRYAEIGGMTHISVYRYVEMCDIQMVEGLRGDHIAKGSICVSCVRARSWLWLWRCICVCVCVCVCV